MKRYYRQDDSQWLQRVDGNPVLSAEECCAHAEAEYGITGVCSFDVEDDAPDPRSGELLQPPPKPVPPPPPIGLVSPAEAAALPPQSPPVVEAVREILAKENADITAAEVKTLVLVMARFLFRKWLAGWR